ncbi:MAG: hypothetical protein M3O46_23290 [Myxococcota bacterium]|nr:hypothetical protein [Myxococcota bacterium]
MMIRRILGVAAALTGTSAAAFIFAGCGDDSGVSPQTDASADASSDASGDSTLDHVVTDAAKEAKEGGADATAMETSVGSDASDASDSAAPTCTLFDAATLDGATVATGLDLVTNVYRCWRCHQNHGVDSGVTLEGRDMSLSDAGAIFPSNLTPDMTGLGCWTNDQVQTAILTGVTPDGGTMCVMPKFGLIANDAGTEPMDAGTAATIIEFLRSLPPVAHTVSSTVCPMRPADAGNGGDASDGAADAAMDAMDASAADAADASIDGGADAGDAADGE